MIEPDRLIQQFNAHYTRTLAEATRLRGMVVVIFGVGAVGGFIASWLARHGVSLLIIDMDRIDPANLVRFVLSDPKWIGQFKATALAQQLRSERPALQSVRSIVANIRTLTREQFDEIFAQANLVVASTGRTDLDRILDQWARHRSVPILFPSLLAGHDTFLGDLQVVAWNLGTRVGGCFACVRPEQPSEPPPAEAQSGAAIDVLRIAELTTDVALTLLSEGPKRRALVRGLQRGINYFVVPHWPPAPRRVQTTARTGCPVCQGAPTSTVASGLSFSIRTRDWVMGGSLVTTILCHQFVPGFDYAATILFVTAAGFWWRGSLPTFERVADIVRRTFEGR